MRINVTPYGYFFRQGKLVINPEESLVVQYIFMLASLGDSLSQISSKVSIKYPNVVFNKNKVSRIIKDERYKGNDDFECIIEEGLFNRANELQNSMSTKNENAEGPDILRILLPFICPKCHCRMKRYHDKRRRCSERWKCTNSKCAFQIRFSDTDMENEIKEIVENIRNLEIEYETDMVKKNIGTARLEMDIKHRLESGRFDKDQLREDVLNLVTMKYDDITDIGFRKQIIKDASKAEPEQCISIVNRVAAEIRIEVDKTITMILRDGTKQRSKIEDDSTLRQRKNDNANCTNENVV